MTRRPIALAVRLALDAALPVGRRSLLWGVHQFLWHPITVALAWRRLYRRWPNWREALCIIVHDWGYWTARDMDGPTGRRHPEIGAAIAGWLLGPRYRDLVLWHSRHYAAAAGSEPSALCWPDKLHLLFDPWWLYVPRALLSGELAEYRAEAVAAGLYPPSASHRAWHGWLRGHLARVAMERCDDIAEAQAQALQGVGQGPQPGDGMSGPRKPTDKCPPNRAELVERRGPP